MGQKAARVASSNIIRTKNEEMNKPSSYKRTKDENKTLKKKSDSEVGTEDE